MIDLAIRKHLASQQKGKPYRWLIFLFCTLSCFSACSSTNASVASVAVQENLILYNWEDDIPQAVLDAFTAKYGIKITYLVYDSQEEAIENLRAGKMYDVLTMESRFIPLLVNEKLLDEIDYRNIPNFKNIAANFRDLVYDPSNRHSVPYNWGTTGLVVRSDLVKKSLADLSWADLWDPRYAGKVAIWRGQPREVLALTLKSLGYSANSENPTELEVALAHLLLLKPQLVFLEDFDLAALVDAWAGGKIVLAMGYAGDFIAWQQKNPSIAYVLPKEGPLLWNDNFIIPANSPHKTGAELFVNFLLLPKINAEITNIKGYATANEAAKAYIRPEILNNPVIFPVDANLHNADLILPLSPQGQKLYDDIWARFLAANP